MSRRKLARRRVQEGTLISPPKERLEMVPPARGMRAQEGTLLREPIRGATGATGPIRGPISTMSSRPAWGATGPTGATFLQSGPRQAQCHMCGIYGPTQAIFSMESGIQALLCHNCEIVAHQARTL